MSTVHTPAVTAKGAAKCSNPQACASSGDSPSFSASPHLNRLGRSHPAAPLPLGSLSSGLRLAFPLTLLRRSPRHARCRSRRRGATTQIRTPGSRGAHQGSSREQLGRRIRSRAEPAPSRSVPADVRATKRRRARGGGSGAFFPGEARRSGDAPAAGDPEPRAFFPGEARRSGAARAAEVRRSGCACGEAETGRLASSLLVPALPLLLGRGARWRRAPPLPLVCFPSPGCRDRPPFGCRGAPPGLIRVGGVADQ
jgi:hypothetical protein